MYSANSLINQILKLKNVNIIELLYYGFKRELIDAQFCIHFATEVLSRGLSSEQLIFELASLLPYETKQATDLINNAITNKDKILIDQGQFYNKIWFYLSYVALMEDKKLIS